MTFARDVTSSAADSSLAKLGVGEIEDCGCSDCECKEESAARASALRRPEQDAMVSQMAQLLALSKLTSGQQQQLVDYANLQMLSKLTPSQQQQLVNYANLQMLSKLSLAQQQQLVNYTTASRRLKKLDSEPTVGTVVEALCDCDCTPEDWCPCCDCRPCDTTGNCYDYCKCYPEMCQSQNQSPPPTSSGGGGNSSPNMSPSDRSPDWGGYQDMDNPWWGEYMPGRGMCEVNTGGSFCYQIELLSTPWCPRAGGCYSWTTNDKYCEQFATGAAQYFGGGCWKIESIDGHPPWTAQGQWRQAPNGDWYDDGPPEHDYYRMDSDGRFPPKESPTSSDVGTVEEGGRPTGPTLKQPVPDGWDDSWIFVGNAGQPAYADPNGNIWTVDSEGNWQVTGIWKTSAVGPTSQSVTTSVTSSGDVIDYLTRQILHVPGELDAPTQSYGTDSLTISASDLNVLGAPRPATKKGSSGGNQGKTTASAGPGWKVTFTLGCQQWIQQGGTLAQLTNNPGDITGGNADGVGLFPWTDPKTGQKYNFVIFPDVATGFQAMVNLLRSCPGNGRPCYGARTIKQVFYGVGNPSRQGWAPASAGNSPGVYVSNVVQALGNGVTENTAMFDLTPDQVLTMAQVIARIEGFYQKGKTPLITTSPSNICP
ncbi:MAG TPA: hypothetical protein VHC69_07020 [Polyangiaceae bacterium]|nr:hypothetical protein [Polyangiaceae bacterium]